MAEFRRGDRVVRIIDGAVGIVRENRGEQTRVFFSRGDEPWIQTANLASADCDWRVFERLDLLRHLVALKFDKPLEDNFYAANASRARFEVHQFKPALKFFDSDRQRLLIADEVGLGKTIEAGIIYQELNARNQSPLERVLVVCPSGLKEKWHQELLSRFGEDFIVADSRALVRRIELFHQGQRRFKVIVPLETIRVDPARKRLQEAIDEGLDFDLTIVDEAHHLRNPETGSHQIAEAIADASAHLLLLTATPVQLGREDLYNILSLFDRTLFPNVHVFNDVIEPNRYVNLLVASLNERDWKGAKAALSEVLGWSRTSHFANSPFLPRVEAFLAAPSPDPRHQLQAVRDAKELHTLSGLVTRTRKREVLQATAARRSQVICVPLTPEERAYYEAVKEYARTLVSGSSWNASAFAVIARERQAASCIPASREYFAQWAGGSRADLGVEGWLTDAPPTDRADASSPLSRLLELGRRCRTDSKFSAFHDALRMTLDDSRSRKVLVFSFFKRTLGYLEKRLREEGIPTLLISGDVDPSERASRIRRFKDGECQVMLSSEVGAEGLDFQFCSALFNYDLPWNPMRVEQRIGRLDRYGQESPVVNVTSLFLKDTIEERILLRLYDRIGVFEETIGALEPILGNVIAQLERDLFVQRLSPDQELALSRQVEMTIENRKLESEIFSARMDEFLGNDDLIAQVEDRRERGLTTEAEDVLETVQHAADTVRARITPVPGHTGVWVLGRSPELASAVQQFARQSRLQMSEEQTSFLSRIRVEERWVIFDGETATRYDDVPFLGTAHPLTRWAIQLSIDELAQLDKTPVYRVRIAADSAGLGFLFVFRFIQHAARAGARLHPFYWRHGEWAPDDEAWETFGKLRESRPCRVPLDDRGEFDTLDEEVFAHAAGLRNELLEDLQTRNDAVIAARNSSIERTIRAKLSSAERRLRTATEPRIRRMLEGRVNNLSAELSGHRASARTSQPVDVSYEPVMRVMIESCQD